MTRAVSLVLFMTTTQPFELPSVMVISKSSNKNEVHYAAYVDADCAPATQAPIHPYWRMLERGPNVTETLSKAELGVLGVARQEVSGESIHFVVNGLLTKTFVAHTARGEGGACTSWVNTTIAGAEAKVVRIWAKQSLFGVDYVLLTGRTAEGKLVEERVRP